MSDLQQMNPFQHNGPFVSTMTVETLTNNFPLLKHLLTCPPEDLLNTIDKMSQLPEEETKKSLRKYSKMEQFKVSSLLLQQLKRVTSWDIDHMHLFNNLVKISKFFWIDVNRFYMILLLTKIENGLHFLQIYEKVNDIPVRGVYQRDIPTMSSASIVSKQLQNSYKVTITQSFKNDPDYRIYYKRYNGLANDEQKLKYRLKLIQELMNIKMPESNPSYMSPWGPPRQPFSGRPRRSDIDQDINKIYNILQTTQYAWLLQELIKIDCPKTSEYKKIISSLKLVKIQDQGQKVILESSPKIKANFLTQNVLKSCLKIENQTQSNLFNQGSFLESNGNIYLKYDITQLLQVSLDYIGTIRMLRQMSMVQHQQGVNLNQSKIRQNFINIITKIYPVIRNITQNKPILVYKDMQFTPIPQEKGLDVLLFCLKMVEKIIQIGKLLKFNEIVGELLISPQFINYLNQIMKFIIIQQKLDKATQIFCLICSNLEELILKNQIKMAIMKNQSFLDLFIQSVNLIIIKQELKALPAKVQSFLISYIPKLFEYGLKIQKFNLEKIYQLKLNNLSNQNIRIKSEMRYRMNLDNQQLLRMRQRQGMQGRSTLQQFIQVFPASINYFNEKLVGQTKNIQTQFDIIDIFDDKIPDKVKYLLKIFANQNIVVDQRLKESFKKLIVNHPTVLLKNSSNPNWRVLKRKLQINEEQILKSISESLNIFRQNHAVQLLPSDQLCQKASSSNKNLIDLLNSINYVHIMLKMRQKNSAFPHAKELMEITLFMEKFQSISLNKIVTYQATYNEEKVRQIRTYYRELQNSKNILHYKITDFCYDLASTCWEIIGQLDLKHFNLFLKEYSLYFQAMKCVDDKNLVLKLIKKTYRSLYSISQKKNINFFFQFYNYNKKIINQALGILYKYVGNTKGISQDTVVMGESYLKFVQVNRQRNKDPAHEFNIIIRPHIQHSLQEFINLMFFKFKYGQHIFNNKSYSGEQNILNIARTMLCDVTKRTEQNFSIENLNFYSHFISIIQQKGLKPSPSTVQTQNDLQIHVPQQNLVIVNKQQKDKIVSQNYIAILQKIQQNRYEKAHISQLQSLFFNIVDKLQSKYDHPHEQRKLINSIFKQIGLNSQNIDFDQQKFKIQCIWIDNVLKKIKKFQIQEVVSQHFIKNYLKLALKMLNNPEQFKQSLPNSILILQKFIPRNFADNKQQLIEYGHTLLEIIMKMINCCISFKKVDYEIVYSIALAIVQIKNSQFDLELRSLLSILQKGNRDIGLLLCELIGKQSQLASMQSDIKGVFLKESQNLVDESQDRISIRLQTFINTFKNKYEEEIATFTNLTSKFVKKNIKSQEKKETVYLSYQKSCSYSYSQILKKDFINFEPSQNIKIIIKNLLSFEDVNQLKNSLISFRDLFYYSPLIIPYVMLHPVKTSKGYVEFIDYLVEKVSQKKIEVINKFLLFSCLDHTCIIKLKEKAVFFSQYLCYRIIKQIINVGINKHTLFFTYYMSQLKRFSYLTKIQLSKTTKKSLINVIIDYLKSTRQGFQYKNCDNNLVYLIMAIVFKQDIVENLKKCFIPKKPKILQAQYKLINQCLIPYNVYYRRLIGGSTYENRQHNIAFTGNLITPFYSEINEDIFMDQTYEVILPKYYQPSSNNVEQKDIIEYSLEKLAIINIKALSSIKNEIKYKSTENMLDTQYNERHKSMISKIVALYFKEDDDQNSLNRINQRNIFQDRQEDELRGSYGRRHPNELRRYRERMIHPNRRNQNQTSRYAPQDYNVANNTSQQKKKTVEKQFEKSLNNIPSEQIIMQEKSSSNFEDIKTGGQELQLILNQINDKLFLLGKEPINEAQLNGKNFLEKKAFLETKQIQIDFDYNKAWLSPQQFEEYCLSHSSKFEKLQPKRREEVLQAQQRLWTFNLQRSPSSDSIDYMLDAIDQNHQHIPNINRTLSRSESLSSYGQEPQIFETQTFHFQNNMLSFRAFSDINEELLYQMLLNFYYSCDAFASKQFMPFLQNKKIQNQLVNTLLYIMKNPFNNKHFPSCIFKFNEKQFSWKKIQINQSNKQFETKHFIERILPIFESVKNYSFYQNDEFLLEQISNEGILGIKYQLQGERNHYTPIIEILQYAYTSQKSVFFDLLNGVKQLPKNHIQKVLQIIQKSQTETNNNEQSQHVFVMGRVFQRPQRKARNTFPYQNLKELFKSEQFKQKFKQIYILGVKDPTPALLTHLISSQIYTDQELKTFHIKILQKQPDDANSFKFLNKITQIYTDQQLKQAKWVKQHRQILAKVLEYLNFTQKKVNDEPLCRIFNATKDLGFEIKRVMFEKEIQQRRKQIHYDFEEIQRQGVNSRKQKGIFQSAFQDLKNKPDTFWLSPFSVKFTNESGKKQTGFGDGVKRQWFTLLSKAMVNLNYGLFRRTPKNYYFFNRQSYINPRHLQYFEFIGKLFGYSLTKSSIFVSPSFSILLYKMILEEEITFNDILVEFEDQAKYYNSIQNLVGKSNEQIVASGLTFTYIDKRLFSSQSYKIPNIPKEGLTIENQSPKKDKVARSIQIIPSKQNIIKELHTQQEQKALPEKVNVMYVNEIIELKPGGSSIEVNGENFHEFIELTRQKIYQIIVNDVKKQFEAFMEGFKRIIKPKSISKFTAKQLRDLFEGTSVISIEDIQKYTKNRDVDAMTTALLWQSLEELSNQDRAIFLWNWTGVDKMPVEGAKIMGLSINAARSGPNFIAHTCPKSLQVPYCQTKKEMDTAVTITLNNVKTGHAFISD